jgi:dihydroorotate dehydrogenase
LDNKIDALIVANTTITRPALKSSHLNEAGGVSGAPLASLALEQLRLFRAIVGSDLPLISAGGIGSADDVWQRICAGASLVQLYSALVYEGPGLARNIAYGLAERLKQSGMSSISEAIGSEAR